MTHQALDALPPKITGWWEMEPSVCSCALDRTMQGTQPRMQSTVEQYESVALVQQLTAMFAIEARDSPRASIASCAAVMLEDDVA